MEVLWTNIFAALIFVALAASSQVVLVDEPGCNSCAWVWEDKIMLEGPNIIGVRRM